MLENMGNEYMGFVQKEARNLTEKVLQLQDAYEEYLDVEQVIM